MSAVELWIAELDAGWPGPEGLPSEERERAERLATDALQRRWSAARWALRAVLGARLGEDPAAVAIEVAAGGKPRLAGDGPRFNLSHSGALALIALASTEVGVDVERLDRDRDVLALAPHALDPAATAAVREAPPERRHELFYAAWARREAEAKCRGEGIWTDPAGGPERPAVVSLAPPPGFAAALAVAAERMPPQRWRRLAPGPATQAVG